MMASSSVLEARNIEVRLGARAVLESVNLQIVPGEFIALVGPNGAGKTTLIETLSGARTANRGTVELFGQALSDWSPQERAKRLALVGREENSALSLTVREVVSLGRLPHQVGWGLSQSDRNFVDQALEVHACSHLAKRRLFTLSDGERQRVSWARAEAQDPAVLLLDEATAHLDLRHREESFERARRFTKNGGAVLAIVHDLSLAHRHCSQVAVLSAGILVCQDAPSVALSPSRLRDVFCIDSEIIHTARGQALVTYGVHT